MDQENIRKHNPIQNEPLDNKLSITMAKDGIESDEIPGYVAPSTYKKLKTTYSKSGGGYKSDGYKSFNANTNQVNNTATYGGNYISQSNMEGAINVEEQCPVCSSEAKFSCPCGYSDKTCPQGHTWFTDRNGKTKLGNPHVKF